MPTELPYAADAEVSLSYDELDVYNLSPPTSLLTHIIPGLADTIPERTYTNPCHYPNQV
jgi:hypothetical protein